MKIWKYSGAFLMVTGILHTIVAIILGKDAYWAIIQDGIVNAVGEDYTRAFAFWFLVCGLFLILFGQVLHFYIKKTQQPAPLFLGYSMLLISILGCCVEPASGFWLFIPQAIIIIAANRKLYIH